MINLPLAEKPVKVKLIVLLIIVLASVFLFSLIGFLLLEPIFGIKMSEAASIMADPEDQLRINALKFIQLLNALSVFIIPPLIFVFLVTNQKLKYFNLDRAGTFMIYLIIPALMIAAMPLINFLAELNKAIHLPEWLSGLEEWMKKSEENAERITKSFLQVDDVAGLIYNILLIAIIPAIGEELLFRGTLQRLFSEGTGNKHLAIWISAILFSTLHFQFYGFFPRMLMGALFGYMLVWSGSLWAPIFAHFVNNCVAVVAFYLVQKGAISPDIEHIGEGEGTGLQVTTSALIIFGLLWFFYAVSKRKEAETFT